MSMDDAHKWGTELSSVSLLEAVLCADCEIISNSAGEQVRDLWQPVFVEPGAGARRKH